MLTKFQAGFVNGNRTANNIFVSKTVVHRYLRNKTGYVYWCFVDMEKGFYSINREALWYKTSKKEISGNMVECTKTTQLDDGATNKEITTQQEHKHSNIQVRSTTDGSAATTTTTTVINVNTTTMTQYPVTARAPDANTVLEINNGTAENSNATHSMVTDVEAPFDDTIHDDPLYKEPRTSRRKKKPPTTKNDDFLWETTIKCQTAIQ